MLMLANSPWLDEPEHRPLDTSFRTKSRQKVNLWGVGADGDTVGRRLLSFNRSAIPRAQFSAGPTLGSPRAIAAAQAAALGDHQRVVDLLAGIEAANKDLLVDAVTHAVGAARPAWFDELTESPTNSAIGYLLRGSHRVRVAFAAHGSLANDVEICQFQRLLTVAETDLFTASQLDKSDTAAWGQLLLTGRGLGLERDELMRRFDRASPAGTWLPFAHHQMVQVLSEKWLGEPGEAIDFARLVSSVAPLGCQLHDLVPAAHLEAAAWNRRRQGRRITTTLSAVGEEILVAAERSVEQSDYDDRDQGVQARNMFALALTLVGAKSRALDQFRRIENRISLYPWQYFGAPADEFLRFARLAASG